VTEVHWRIIANLGFKFRSHFIAHCGRRAVGGAVLLAVRLAGGSSRSMLASARLCCCRCCREIEPLILSRRRTVYMRYT